MLSKSKFIKGVQCKKRLYLDKFHAQLNVSRDSRNELQEMLFHEGHRIGELARQLYPGGLDLTPDDFRDWEPSIAKTTAAVKQELSPLYEAAFVFDQLFAAVDILVKTEEGWRIVEVKSSTSIKEVVVMDAAVQYYVLTALGINITDVSILHINNRYVRKQELVLDQFFNEVSVLEEVLNLQEGIPNEIAHQMEVLRSSVVPEPGIGKHCRHPHNCEFKGYCWAHVPVNSVFDISNMQEDQKWKLYERGMLHLVDIPEHYQLSRSQQLQVRSAVTREEIIKMSEIQTFLEELIYPLYFLDFETYNTAIPQWPGACPYEQIPFQYSVHIQKEPGGEVAHVDFLAEADGADPREAFTENLVRHVGEKGSVIVYNQSFEKMVLKNLMKLFPDHYDKLSLIRSRVTDLMKVFQNKAVYTPEMQGSYSIKKVLPALVPELSYDSLEIGNGASASSAYANLIRNNNEEEVSKIRQHLLKYCEQDTLAMVRLLEKLYRLLS